MAEPPSVCARRSEAVPEALGRLGMRAGGSGPHRSGQAALAGRARHTPAWLPMEPSGGWVAGSLCHDSAGAAARGLAVGGGGFLQQGREQHGPVGEALPLGEVAQLLEELAPRVLFFSLFQWILPNYSMNSSGRCSNWFTTAGEN